MVRGGLSVFYFYKKTTSIQNSSLICFTLYGFFPQEENGFSSRYWNNILVFLKRHAQQEENQYSPAMKIRFVKLL